MKHSEFVEMVNTVAMDERNRTADRINAIANDKDAIAKMIAESLLQASEISARVTATIIEKSGLLRFED